MAWYRIAYRPGVVDDLKGLEKTISQRLFDKTKWLASNVENLRHESVDPGLPGLFQYAIGEWRILYSIDKQDQVLDVHLIRSATGIYEREGSGQKQ